MCLCVRVYACVSSYVCPETFFPRIKFSIREARCASCDKAELFLGEGESEGKRGKTKGGRGTRTAKEQHAKVQRQGCDAIL